MKFVFIDKNETEAQFIKNVLSKWNVPYHVNVKERQDMMSFFRENTSTIYDIEINVEYEFYQFLCSEIYKMCSLERSLSLVYKPQAKIKTTKEQAKSLDEILNRIKADIPKQSKKQKKANNFVQNLIQHVMRNYEGQGLVEQESEEQSTIPDPMEFLTGLFTPCNDFDSQPVRVKFEDLSKAEQEMLKKDVPENILKKSTTVIYKTPTSLSVCIEQ